ncbi:Cation transport regulator-like protein 2 [Physocladia obscura]|uniref:glutathione-specific gamma-glutamylcyclotransferase n=1 Tax=Physocladia obscura TaxID=109957 RepID=A0AAD5T1P3_9FUNG|nr:Cation transport regulator-like protein 2 [Physocladia obscura]
MASSIQASLLLPLAEQQGTWVFGYGSLIWKIDFPYERRVVCHVRGLHRRFWQGSHDHRGTPTAPGRVVTLVGHDEYMSKWRAIDSTPAPPLDNDAFGANSLNIDSDSALERCFGVAYKLPRKEVDRVLAHLDFREKNGYSAHSVPIYTDSSNDPFAIARVYIGNTDNVAFLGPASVPVLASHIVRARGPSGRNIDYFLNLCAAVRVISSHNPDVHLSALEERVRTLAVVEKVAITEPNEDALQNLQKLVETGRTGLFSNRYYE